MVEGKIKRKYNMLAKVAGLEGEKELIIDYLVIKPCFSFAFKLRLK